MTPAELVAYWGPVWGPLVSVAGIYWSLRRRRPPRPPQPEPYSEQQLRDAGDRVVRQIVDTVAERQSDIRLELLERVGNVEVGLTIYGTIREPAAGIRHGLPTGPAATFRAPGDALEPMPMSYREELAQQIRERQAATYGFRNPGRSANDC